MGRGLLAADAAGAEEGQGPGPLRFHQGAQLPLHPSGKLPKGGRSGIDGPSKRSHGHLIGIAGVDHQGLGIRDQGVPVLGVHVGAHRHGGIHLRPADRDNLPFEPHLEAVEGLDFGAVALHLQGSQARIGLLQELQQLLHAGLWTAHGAIHPLRGEQHRALHVPGAPHGQNPLAQLREMGLGQGGEAIKGGHLQAHRARAGSVSTSTPAAANSSRSAATSGLPVVSRVSP